MYYNSYMNYSNIKTLHMNYSNIKTLHIILQLHSVFFKF